MSLIRLTRQCSVPGCNRERSGQLYCKRHEALVHRNGRPQGRWVIGEQIVWMHKNVFSCNSEACLIWPFPKTAGYGAFQLDGRTRRAHQVAWELYNVTPFPAGLIARHLCGNGHLGCVNPLHIAPGTNAENVKDRASHGRTRHGEQHGRAILSEDQVVAIKSRLRAGDRGIDIAHDFDISPRLVSSINRGHSWKHV